MAIGQSFYLITPKKNRHYIAQNEMVQIVLDFTFEK
jgi:hypothetical protein